MAIKRFNVVTKTTYQQNGEEKTKWNNVGRIVQFDNGGIKLELNMYPNTDFAVFEEKPKETQSNDF